MADADEFLPMGVIGRPHGIKGEVGSEWWGDFIPAARMPVVLKLPDGSENTYKVVYSHWHKGRLLLTLSGIQDRTAAEALKGATIFISRKLLPPLEEGEAYLKDLPGCTILLPDRKVLGTLDHFEFPAGQEIWAIKDDGGQEILFPARNSFIKSIDTKAREIVIDPPPGLVEIYRA